MDTPTTIDEKDVEQIEDMLNATSLEFESDLTETDEYKLLYTQAKELYPDMPTFFIQMALLSHLDEIHNTVKNI